MPITSMTGFARAEGGDGVLTWTWETRSVNAKGLDIRFRLAPGFERLDQAVRGRVQKRFKRGSLTVNLNVRSAEGVSAYRVNEVFLDSLLEMLPALKDRVPDVRPPSLDGLLGLRGVIEQAEGRLDDDAFQTVSTAMLKDLDAALGSLAAARAEEGQRLLAPLSDLLERIATLSGEAGRVAALQPDALRRKLEEQVALLVEDVPALPEERLAQEAALLMTKADVREELDRLVAHVASARELLTGDGAVGRRIDFLCQEFNREANTLCSKSQDVELTRIGLELKTAIEQFREQIQNIE